MVDVAVEKKLPLELERPKKLDGNPLLAFQNNRKLTLEAFQKFIQELRQKFESGGSTIDRHGLPIELSDSTFLRKDSFFVVFNYIKSREQDVLVEGQIPEKIRGTLYPDDIANVADGIITFLNTIGPRANFSFSTISDEWHHQANPTSIDVTNEGQVRSAYERSIHKNLVEILEHIEFLIENLTDEVEGSIVTKDEVGAVLAQIKSRSAETIHEVWETLISPLVVALREAEPNITEFYVKLEPPVPFSGQSRDVIKVEDILAIANEHARALQTLVLDNKELEAKLPEINRADKLRDSVIKLTFVKQAPVGSPESNYYHISNAEKYVEYFAELYEYLTGKKKLEEQAEVSTEGAEDDTGGGEADQTQQVLPINQVLQQANQLFFSTLNNRVFAQLSDTDNRIAQLDADQLQTYQATLDELLNDWVAANQANLQDFVEQLLSQDNTNLPADSYNTDNELIVSPAVIEFVQEAVATAFIQANAANLEAVMAAALTPPAAQTAQAQPPTSGEPEYFATPGAVIVPPGATLTAENIQQSTSIFPTSDELPKIIRLRQTVYFQLFGSDAAFDEQFLGDINGYMLWQITNAVRQNPGVSPESLLFQILRDRAVINRVSQFYDDKLRTIFAEGAARRNIEIALETLMVITTDPTLLLNSLTDQEFEQLFGFSIVGKDRAQVLKLLQGFFYFNRTVYGSRGLAINAWDGGTPTSIEELKKTLAHLKPMAVKLDAQGVGIAEVFNADDEYFDDPEYGKTLSDRKRMFIEQFQQDFLNQMLMDEEMRAQLQLVLEQDYGVEVHEGDDLRTLIPQGVSEAELVSKASAKGGPGVADKMIGKAALNALKVLAPEAAPLIMAAQKANELLKQYLGIDLEAMLGQKLRETLEPLLKIAAIAGGFIIYMFSHLGTWIGAGVGSLLIPFIGAAGPVLGAIAGFGIEKGIVQAAENALGGASDAASQLFGGGGGSAGGTTSASGGLSGGGGIKLPTINLGNPWFAANAGVAGFAGMALVSTIITNNQRIATARPINPNLQAQEGEFSPYVDVTKTASPSKIENGTAETITYTLTITPKDGYVITPNIEGSSDKFSYLGGDPLSLPDQTETVRGLLQSTPIGQPMTYTVSMQGTDVLVTNTFTFSFTAEKDGESVQDDIRARASVTIGNPKVGCLVEGPSGFNFQGVTSKAWGSDWSRILSAFNNRAASNTAFVENLCGQGSVEIYRLPGGFTDQYGGWAPGAYNGDKLAIYDYGLSFTDASLEYTLVHELGHILDYRNDSFMPGFMGVWSGSCYTYPLGCSAGEAFPEGVALYVVGDTYVFTTGKYDLESSNPAEYNWYKETIFGNEEF
jgi:hypothetical protein